MMIGHSFVLDCLFSHSLRFFWNVIRREHTYICTDPQDFFCWNCVAVESSAVKKNEVSCLWIYFHAVRKAFLFFIFICKFIPIIFLIFHIMINEPFLVNKMSLWTTNKTSFFLARICQGLNTWITPKSSVDWCLVTMYEWIDWARSIISFTIHETETIERTLEIFCIPKSLK